MNKADFEEQVEIVAQGVVDAFFRLWWIMLLLQGAVITALVILAILGKILLPNRIL